MQRKRGWQGSDGRIGSGRGARLQSAPLLAGLQLLAAGCQALTNGPPARSTHLQQALCQALPLWLIAALHVTDAQSSALAPSGAAAASCSSSAAAAVAVAAVTAAPRRSAASASRASPRREVFATACAAPWAHSARGSASWPRPRPRKGPRPALEQAGERWRCKRLFAIEK